MDRLEAAVKRKLDERAATEIQPPANASRDD
jgi:hypothetical protein